MEVRFPIFAVVLWNGLTVPLRVESGHSGVWRLRDQLSALEQLIKIVLDDVDRPLVVERVVQLEQNLCTCSGSLQLNGTGHE